MSFEQAQQQLNEARNTTENRRKRLKKNRQTLSNIALRKRQLHRQGGANGPLVNEQLEQLSRQEADLTAQVAQDREDWQAALATEQLGIERFAQWSNPLENIDRFEDSTPILMFPLRLETRFKTVTVDGQERQQLWLRVFPDDIAIDSFESDLSTSEIRNIEKYWINRWRAGRRQQGNKAAWRNLASSHGPGRAYWLTRNYQPENIAEEPQINEGEVILVINRFDLPPEPLLTLIKKYWAAVWRANGDKGALDTAWQSLLMGVGNADEAKALVLGNPVENINEAAPNGVARDDAVVRVEYVRLPDAAMIDAKLHGWSQPPTSNVLPERFVFLAYHQGELDMEPQLGLPVPSNLILGPDPAAEAGEDFRLATAEDAAADPAITEGDLLYAEQMAWMFDFDDAIAKGMGFKIDLTAEQARRGFDRVLVMGVKLAADKEMAQERLETLFNHHHSSRKGMSIIKQGTPSNNTEKQDAGYHFKHNPDDSYRQYFVDTPDAEDEATDWFGKSDGRWLADMLGLDPSKLQDIENYGNRDISDAMAMQRALWPATGGHFMQTMMSPVFRTSLIDSTGEFFNRYVNGRGCIPAIRVGKQPYGILVTSVHRELDMFVAPDPNLPEPEPVHDFNHRAFADERFLSSLYRLLKQMDGLWTEMVEQVSYVGKPGDPHQIMLDVVGLHATSSDLYQRFANTIEQIWNMYLINGAGVNGLYGYLPNIHAQQAEFLAQLGYVITGKQSSPQIFDKVFFDEAWMLKGPRIDKVPNSEADPVSAYTEDGRNYIQWLIDAARRSHDSMRRGEQLSEHPRALLYLLLFHSLDLSYIDTSLKLQLNNELLNGLGYVKAYFEPDFVQVSLENENESRWKHLYRNAVEITGDANQRLEQYIAQALGDIPEAEGLNDVLRAMEQLVDIPTASLERLMLEHIDTVSYRYDAWIAGLLNYQLALMRGIDSDEAENQDPVQRGVYLGAYGWLEDLRPENKDLQAVELDDEMAAIFNPDNDLEFDPTNGGYTLAPSLNHGVTAAILRNGNIANENAGSAEQLQIKLTSERVRLAMNIIEGIQNGQTLSAMLGYHFERGLHDRNDVEVDEFILDLRNAFPLVANKLNATRVSADTPDYRSISQIEANNVIDGVTFLDYVDKNSNLYPFGLDDMPEATPEQRAAINQEVQQLRNIKDAVADLAMAESVHQVVTGNYQRASAILDSYSKATTPPTPDVAKTPRSGLIMTHRVGLHLPVDAAFNIIDPGVTPRMVAEPGMQQWLSDVLPDLSNVGLIVNYFDNDTQDRQSRPVALSDIGLSVLDLLYLLDVDNQQAMSVFDDHVARYVWQSGVFAAHPGQEISLQYSKTVDDHPVSVFEFSALLASLRELLLRSRPLTPSDVKLPGEVAGTEKPQMLLPAERIQPLVDELNALWDGRMRALRDRVTALVEAENVANMAAAIDEVLSETALLFTQAGRFGMSNSGSGFIWQWRQSIWTQLNEKVVSLHQRWTGKREKYIALRETYLAMPADDDRLFNTLQKLELTISSLSTHPLPATPAEYFSTINDEQFVEFEQLLDNTITPLSRELGITALYQGLAGLSDAILPFDVTALTIDDAFKRLALQLEDIADKVTKLRRQMLAGSQNAQALIDQSAAAGDSTAAAELLKQAGQSLFGEQFAMVPAFALTQSHGIEWQSALNDSGQSLRYLENDLDKDFPVDDWLYGIGRVRDKLYHVENALVLNEGFDGNIAPLTPCQFPYRENDYWLAMQYPATEQDSDTPFEIDEDKLLYTAIYAEPFDPGKAQCGLLLDEWTELIPSRDETAGLSFHYDQPNSEPPQSLLLALPNRFSGQWQWQSLVDTLHSTLDMAKKRAVEPAHVDESVMSLFLPSIVSVTTPMPLTSTLNLALNNGVLNTPPEEN